MSDTKPASSPVTKPAPVKPPAPLKVQSKDKPVSYRIDDWASI
ncbi:hypothetical protein N9L47_13715 [Rhodobacteraceae bacterium]|nr:hypothetical protein [Paracoccaceae bacterium]